MARLATIDLDWLDSERASDIYDFRFRGALDYVRKNCKPIDEPDFFTDPNVNDLLKAIQGLLDIVSESSGVYGYHLNGDLADWGEFKEVNFANQIIVKIKP